RRAQERQERAEDAAADNRRCPQLPRRQHHILRVVRHGEAAEVRDGPARRPAPQLERPALPPAFSQGGARSPPPRARGHPRGPVELLRSGALTSARSEGSRLSMAGKEKRPAAGLFFMTSSSRVVGTPMNGDATAL